MHTSSNKKAPKKMIEVHCGGIRKWLLSINSYIYCQPRPCELRITQEEYYRQFDKKVVRKALERAWQTRNFEIEMYWKRATYFWTILGAALVAYGVLLKISKQQAEVVACLGFVLSLAWVLNNIGSKAWQANWEAHIDLLEDSITGPLYKTIKHQYTYSVSKINLIVSCYFVFLWAILFLSIFLHLGKDAIVYLSLVAAIIASFAMSFGYGRSDHSKTKHQMWRREIEK